MQEQARRRIRARTYVFFLLLFSLALFCTHLFFLDLPYYWDEAGYYVPAALDLYHGGHWIPRSVAPSVHPPALSAYLAAAWSIAGYTPAVTRSAMLLLGAGALLAAFLLAIELSRHLRGTPAFLAVALLGCSPLFFAQCMMAQLDMPAMLFTTLALLFFVQDRIPLSAAVCVLLVLVKETGVLAPLLFFLWLARERRWRDAAFFAAPGLVLACWIMLLYRSTGHWLGSASFAQFNFFYPLRPARVMIALLRRIYTLGFANFHWIGLFAIVYAWRFSPIFRTRSWRIASWLLAAHVLLVTVLGGAVLERYLLPIMPILYAAMAGALSLYGQFPRRVCSLALLAGLIACIFINPPYPFPYENNLAFTDFVAVQADAADYLQHWYSGASVTTTWPMTLELSHPQLGYVHQAIAVDRLPDLSPATLDRLDWSRVRVLVAFSRNWNPPLSIMHWEPAQALWRRFYGFVPMATPGGTRARVPFPSMQHFERHGQWVDVYVAPGTPLTPRAPAPVTRVSLPVPLALVRRIAPAR